MIHPADPSLCPDHIAESLDAYASVGCPTGSFLQAVLENNLKEACGRADLGNLAALPAIVGYCYNRIPSSSWGSPERVAAWLKMHAERRAAAVPPPGFKSVEQFEAAVEAALAAELAKLDEER